MKGDFTRFTFDAEKHYRNVLTQQGRVTVDADPNEQQFITSYRIETEAADLIGGCGAPLHDAGFRIAAGDSGLTFGDGRFYANGILCENKIDNRAITDQPDLPANGVVMLPDGTSVAIENNLVTPGIYQAYLDVWLRHVTALEDGSIREVALGGPDTATRVKTAWQVRLFRLGELGASLNCLSESPGFETLKQGTTGKLSAQTAQAEADDKPCVVPPGAGFRRLENQLYRVEVHNGGPLGSATFKWSRDNGSVFTGWKSAVPNPANPANHLDLVVDNIGRDKVLRFAGGQWVELTDDTREETGRTGSFLQVVKVEGDVITVDAPTAFPAGAINIADFPKNAKVRRWDFRDEPAAMKIVKPAAPNDWVKLEDGLEVKFEAGHYRTGDYWLIPVRTIEPFLEWPKDALKKPVPLPPHGIEHNYCKLALVTLDANSKWVDVRDCRKLFPPVTELTGLFYAGGDGQEVMPDLTQPPATFFPLPKPLQVGVANGQWPVKGAKVRFEVVEQNSGRLNGGGNKAEVETNEHGLATCSWELRWAIPPTAGSSPIPLLTQQVKATLLKADGQPSVHLPVTFTANLSLAANVAYHPSRCQDLTGITNVQDAIDKLCERKSGGGCAVTVGKEGEFQTLNDAVKALLERQKDLCICLLPGNHTLTENLKVNGKGDVTITIEGCGRGSHLISKKFGMVFTGLAGLTLAGIDFDFRDNENPLQIERCQAVTITDCDLMGAAKNSTLLTLDDSGRVWIENSVLANFENPRLEMHRSVLKTSPFASLFEPQNQRAFDRSLFDVTASVAGLPAGERQSLAANIRGNAANTPQLVAEEQAAYGTLVNALHGDISLAARLASAVLNLRRAVVGNSNARSIVISNPGNDVTLSDNTIHGLLSLYGVGGKKPITQDMLIQMRGGLFKPRASFNTAEHTLALRNNHLSRVVLADKFIDFLGSSFKPNSGDNPVEIENVFAWLALTENLFDAGNNQLCGGHSSLSTNRFNIALTAAGAPASSLGVVLGKTGSYAANSARAGGSLLVLNDTPKDLGTFNVAITQV